MELYANTIDNARKFGWGLLPEHCIGDRDAPFVVHDPKAGKWYFLRVTS